MISKFSRIMIFLLCLLFLFNSTIVSSQPNLHLEPTFIIQTKGLIGAVAWSPDGKLLAFSDQSADTVEIWEIDSQKKILTLEGDTYSVVSLAWNLDGKRLALLGTRMVVYNIETGENLNNLNDPDNDPSGVGNVDWNPKGDGLSFSSWHYNSSVNKGLKFWIWNENTQEISQIDDYFSTDDDSKMLAIITGEVGGPPIWIRILDLETMKTVDSIEGSPVRIISLDWHPKQELIVYGDMDGMVYIWDLTVVFANLS